MGLINNEEYLFITTCSMTKSYNSDTPIPLVEMYSGVVFKSRYNLMKTLSDEVYFCTPSGPGIVRDDWVTAPYNQMTPNSKLNSPEFQKMHRQLFESRYPGRIEKVKKIFWLGSEHYDKFLKNVFYDKEVIICLEKKMTAAIMKSYLTKLNNTINGEQEVVIHQTWIENGTHIMLQRIVKNSVGEKRTSVLKYKKNGGDVIEDFNYSITDFACELFGVDRETVKQWIIDELGIEWMSTTLITCPWVFKLYERHFGECNKTDIPYTEIKFNPFGQNILNKEFESLILNSIKK